MNKLDAINGCLVADAASMGLHWLYDQSQLAKIAQTGDVLFRAPDENHYRDQKAYFAHAAKRIGELSHYGEQVRVAATVAMSDEGYSSSTHRNAFMQAFGPCGHYQGYADKPTKALIAKMLMHSDELDDPSGMDDDQHPALAVVPGLFAANLKESDVSTGVSVISTNAVAEQSALVLWRCLNMIESGSAPGKALQDSADSATGELSEKMNEALAWPEYSPLGVAEHFGLPCHLHQGMPIVWHLLAHATGFEQCIRDNIMSGGDTCGRAIALASVAGLLFGVPATLSDRYAGPLFH